MGESFAVEDLVPMLSDYMDDLAVSAHEHLGDVAGVAVTVIVDGAPFTIGSSTRLALDVDQIQYEVGLGPCLTALREGIGCYVADLESDPRWGEYGPRAAARGAASCACVPVVVHDRSTAVLKVYSSKVDGLTAHQQRAASAFAGEVAGAIGLAHSLSQQVGETEDPPAPSPVAGSSALSASGRAIDIAVGVLMERNGCGPAEALELLRRNAHSADTAVGDAARAVLAAVPGVDATRWDF
jgi:hypothetical protein